jgi:hypothetical protein
VLKPTGRRREPRKPSLSRRLTRVWPRVRKLPPTAEAPVKVAGPVLRRLHELGVSHGREAWRVQGSGAWQSGGGQSVSRRAKRGCTVILEARCWTHSEEAQTPAAWQPGDAEGWAPRARDAPPQARNAAGAAAAPVVYAPVGPL